MVGQGISLLSNYQIIELCEGAEHAIRGYILSKISKKRIKTLDIFVEADGLKPVNISIEVTLFFSNLNDLDANKLANEAINHGFIYVDQYLENIDANSKNS